jgi:hypothetical protein
MHIDDDSLYVWERHALPDDWQQRLLSFMPEGATAPVVAAVQAIVRQHGDLSIIAWQVQELALAVCGQDRPRFFAAYQDMCARLSDLGGSEWPLTIAINEHLSGDDHVTQIQNRFVACEGEWRALLRLADAGWRPVNRNRGSGDPDWVVKKDSEELSVEVKTKLPLASATGRLTRAFIGLGMLRRFAFLRNLDYSWFADDHLNDTTVRTFIASFIENADLIGAHGSGGQVMLMPLFCDAGALRMRVRSPGSFLVELRTADRRNAGKQVVRRLVLDATPASFADHLFTGGGSARRSDGPDVELPLTSAAFKRLLRVKQMSHFHRDTLLLMMWHMPFHTLSYEPDRLAAFWRSWCDEQGIRRGALQPVTPGGRCLPVFLTDIAARELDLSALCE